jgi:hypothetical protein
MNETSKLTDPKPKIEADTSQKKEKKFWIIFFFLKKKKKTKINKVSKQNFRNLQSKERKSFIIH